MYTLGREDKYVSESEDDCPPKKLTTTLFCEEHSLSPLQEIKHLSNKDPQCFQPDNTRPSSPFLKMSVSNYESLETLYQLSLLRDRHKQLAEDVQGAKSQLNQNHSKAVKELEDKKQTLLSKINQLLEEAVSEVDGQFYSKEKVIEENEKYLNYCISKIEKAISTIETQQKTQNKENSSQVAKSVEKALSVWAPELDFKNQMLDIIPPKFDYKLVRSSRKSTSCNVSVCKRAESSIQEQPKYGTLSNFKDLSKIEEHKEKHKSHKSDRPKRSDSERRRRRENYYETLLKQNLAMAERISRLEKKFSQRSRPPLKPPSETSTTTSYSEFLEATSDVVISTLYSEDNTPPPCPSAFKVYVPQGYPAFSCFYYVSSVPHATFSQVLDSLTEHMKLEKNKYALKVKTQKQERWLDFQDLVRNLETEDDPKVFLIKIK